MKTLAILAAIVTAAPAVAGEYDAAARAFLDAEIRPWAASPMLIDAIRQQNGTTSALSQTEVEQLDSLWQAELGSARTPTISVVVDGPLASLLRDQIARTGGAITEIIVMDARGLNVAASAITSDYWQGDEDKFSQTVPYGPEAVHLGEIEFDDSVQDYQLQISFSLADPVSGEVVGAMTVGVLADALM